MQGQVTGKPAPHYSIHGEPASRGPCNSRAQVQREGFARFRVIQISPDDAGNAIWRA